MNLGVIGDLTPCSLAEVCRLFKKRELPTRPVVRSRKTNLEGDMCHYTADTDGEDQDR